MARLVQYIKDTRAEFKHVSWPTQRQALVLTIMVTIISILVGLFLSAFDYVFTAGLDWFIK